LGKVFAGEVEEEGSSEGGFVEGGGRGPIGGEGSCSSGGEVGGV
jgi:hypothetical protein